MNNFFAPLPTSKSSRIRARISALAGMRGVALLLVWLMIPLGFSGLMASAQEAPPPPPDQQGPPPDQQGPPPDDQGPPPQQWNALSPEQMNQLVAPIALYPDALVAQILAASTYPTQVVDADRFVQSNQGVPPDQMSQMANSMDWDPSVKALTAFPSVLANMDKNLDWTTQLGNAYYNQPQDVMSAVQALRQQAYQDGHLQSSPQLNVTYAPSAIEIVPANPAVVYVPYYDPWAYWGFHPWYRWYAPPPPPGFVVGARFGFGFGVGVAVGAWRPWGWGWGHWGFAWGPHPFVAYNRVTYVSRSVTVVNHGYYGRFDRHPEARAFNRRAAVQVRNVDYHRVTINNNRTIVNNRTVNNYNRNNYNRTNNYRSPNNNYRAPNNSYRPGNNGQQNYSRGNQNYDRQGNTANRPQSDTQVRRSPNFGPMPNNSRQQYDNRGNQNRPQNYNRGNQGRPQGNERPHNDRPQNQGHPQNRGGGDKGEHPHGR